jgi:hypothetical protein
MFWCRVLSEALIEIFGRYFFFFLWDWNLNLGLYT